MVKENKICYNLLGIARVGAVTASPRAWPSINWSNYEGQGVNEDRDKRRNLFSLQVTRYSHKGLPTGSFLFKNNGGLRSEIKIDKI